MTYAIQARWIVPIERPPIQGGIVSVADGRIVAVGENVSGRPPTDLGDVALLPGLVNAHTHLEFSLLDRPLGTPRMPFADWIAEVVAWRRSLAEQFAGDAPGMPFADWIAQVVAWRRGLAEQFAGDTPGMHVYRRRAILAGLEQSKAAGVVAVGEIAMPGCPLDAYWQVDGVSAVTLLELLGRAEERVQPLMDLAESHISAARAAANVYPGLSPHATYSVHPQLLRRACALSVAEQFPVAMHVAESRQELKLLANHVGPLVDLLAKLGAWIPSAMPTGARPLDYLETLQNAHRALVIHGNYLTTEEIEFSGARREQMSVVFCPRTHSYFGHDPYPLAQMLRAGVRVAVGTDSRASNPDLNLLSELRFVATHHPQVPPDKIVEMGTQAAAHALGIEANFGSITVGRRAQFVAFPIMERRRDPCEQVLRNEIPPLPWPPIQAPSS
ncbi:MAG TPA: amidohydrolase family protein [Pirellulaceae bacterium]|nr:amidohydrolase family protein [Pirellulaceae bacterium]